MELKKALAVCLISLFSATLVVLIARSLDSQAASRLEPHLAEMVKELQAIRKAGGIVTAPGAEAGAEAATDDGVIVYYFHGARCPTCRLIESQAHEVVFSDFAAELQSGELTWATVDYLKSPGKELAQEFDVADPSVVLVRMKDGRIQDRNRLDQVWILKDDPPAQADYIRAEIREMLSVANEAEGEASELSPPIIPLDIPIPE